MLFLKWRICMTTAVNGWYDVTAYGAYGDGSHDDTNSCQAAIAACISNGGGTVYFPVGQYLISGPLIVDTSSTHVSVYFQGTAVAGGNNVNTQGGSTILVSQGPSTAAPTYGIRVTGGGTSSGCMFRLADLTMTTTAANTTPIATFDAINTYNVVYVDIERFQLLERHESGTLVNSTTTNSGIHVINAYQARVSECMIHAEVSAVWQDCTTGLVIEDSFLGTTNGTGYGSVRLDSTANTGIAPGSLQIYNTVTGRGDWGLYCGGSDNSPTFIYINNFQVNNPNVGGMYFQAGSQVWVDYAWISMAGTPASELTYGVYCDAGFQGWFYMNDSVIQNPSGHGMWLKGGQGFNIYGNSFGGCGHYQTNSYDDIRIANTVTNVSIVSNHFDVDKFNTMNGARSAIYVEDGATGVNVTGNAFASGYHTGTIIDTGIAVTGGSNTGWTYPWLNVTADTGWSKVSGYAPLRYRLTPERNLQLDGILQHSGSVTSTVPINSGSPLASAYCPDYTAFFPSGNSGGRCPVQIDANGIISAIGVAGSSNTYAEFHAIISLD
jgi:hypothetical protein